MKTKSFKLITDAWNEAFDTVGNTMLIYYGGKKGKSIVVAFDDETLSLLHVEIYNGEPYDTPYGPDESYIISPFGLKDLSKEKGLKMPTLSEINKMYNIAAKEYLNKNRINWRI